MQLLFINLILINLLSGYSLSVSDIYCFIAKTIFTDVALFVKSKSDGWFGISSTIFIWTFQQLLLSQSSGPKIIKMKE